MESTPEEISRLEEFRQRYGQELDELLEMGFYDTDLLPPDPSSMGIGETNLEDLGIEEINIVKETLFRRLGVVPSDPEQLHREYSSEAPQESKAPGRINVRVFKTKTDGLYLQEMNFSDNQQRFVLGPDSNI